MSLRRKAADTLSKILDEGAYSNLALKQAASGLEERDARFLHALVYSTLEHLYYIDYVLSHHVRRQKRVIRSILRLGACELLYLSTPPYAAVSAYVELCRECGKGASASTVNAVLRKVSAELTALPPLPADPVERLSMEFSCPPWIVNLWVKSYGLDFTRALLETPPCGMQLRAQYPTALDELMKSLPVSCTVGRLDSECLYAESGFDIEKLPIYIRGGLAVQSEGSMMICRALGDLRGKRVLDACAAPGGKSAYLYSLCGGELELSCFELHPHRLELMRKSFERLHVNARLECRDAAEYDPVYDSAFDAVLLDAPCSGLGLINEKLDLRYKRKEEDIASLVELQRRLMDSVSRYTRVGGTFVYSTCTINPAENDEQVAAFLGRAPGFRLEGTRQLFPNIDGTDGFYYARMTRWV